MTDESSAVPQEEQERIQRAMQQILTDLDLAAETGDEGSVELSAAAVQSISDRVRAMEQAGVARPVPVDGEGRLQEPPLVARLQQHGAAGMAEVVTSEALGETHEKRSFYLELIVYPADGSDPFDAGMRLHIRRSSPQRSQELANPGSLFAVRFDPAFVQQVVIDPSEVGR